jgi:hypothetical protein
MFLNAGNEKKRELPDHKEGWKGLSSERDESPIYPLL